MNSGHVAQERRREHRLPFAIPVTLSKPSEETESLVGRVENISVKGAQIALEEKLPSDIPVCISFHMPHHDPGITNSGHIKWSMQTDGLHRIGIEMVDDNQVRMTLNQVNEILSALDKAAVFQPQAGEETSLERLRSDFSFQVYWGMLFWTFKDYLHTHFSSLSCDLSMGSFYLDQAIEKLQKEAEDLPGWRQYQDILGKIDSAVSSINRFSTLFRLMKEEHPKNNHENFPEFLSLDALLSDRIHCLKQKLSAMLIPYAGEITYSADTVPELIGVRSSLTRGIDFLLLYAYQSLLYQRARSLQLNLSTDQDSLIVDFIHDGSQSLHQRFLEIGPNTPLQFSGLHPKDKRQISWLFLTMQFFADQKARLLLVNESGKNVISLRIPKTLSRSHQSPDTEI